MRWSFKFGAIALAAFALLSASARDASAGFVLTNPTTPAPKPPIIKPRPIGDPIWVWEIDVWLVGSADGTQLKKNESFLTFYDIFGLIPGSNSQPGAPHPFAGSFALIGRTPDPAPSGIDDDPDLLNVTFTYVGNNTITLFEDDFLYLGKFAWLSDSTLEELPEIVQFAGSAPTRRGGPDITSVDVRVVAVPEPASMALMVPGALLLGLVARRRRRARG